MMQWISILIACLGLVVLTHCSHVTDPVTRGEVARTPEAINPDPFHPGTVPSTIVFERDLKPFLEVKCVQCHNSIDAQQNAGLNLETRKLAMTTGRNPPVIIPKDPKNSLIVRVLELNYNHPMNMPPSPDKIWGTRMKILKKWIRQGAKWPDDVKMTRPQDQPN